MSPKRVMIRSIEGRLPGTEVVAELQDLDRIGPHVVLQGRHIGGRVPCVDEQDVEIGGRAGCAADGAEGLGPLEHEQGASALREADALKGIDAGARIEVMSGDGAKAVVERAPAVLEAPLIGLPRLVTGRGEERRAAGRHPIHGLCHDPVLEHRLGQVDHVIDDDLGAGRLQLPDPFREVGLAPFRGVEGERRARRDIVHDLQHGPALVGQGLVDVVGVIGTRALLEHRDRREIRAPGPTRGAAQTVEAVGHHAHRDTAAVHPPGGAGEIGGDRRITLARHRARAALGIGRPGGLDGRHGLQGRERRERQAPGHQVPGSGPLYQAEVRELIEELTGVALRHGIDGDVATADGRHGVPGSERGGG
jgi:hypothetical protein